MFVLLLSFFFVVAFIFQCLFIFILVCSDTFAVFAVLLGWFIFHLILLILQWSLIYDCCFIHSLVLLILLPTFYISFIFLNVFLCGAFDVLLRYFYAFLKFVHLNSFCSILCSWIFGLYVVVVARVLHNGFYLKIRPSIEKH